MTINKELTIIRRTSCGM